MSRRSPLKDKIESMGQDLYAKAKQEQIYRELTQRIKIKEAVEKEASRIDEWICVRENRIDESMEQESRRIDKMINGRINKLSSNLWKGINDTRIMLNKTTEQDITSLRTEFREALDDQRTVLSNSIDIKSENDMNEMIEYISGVVNNLKIEFDEKLNNLPANYTIINSSVIKDIADSAGVIDVDKGDKISPPLASNP